MITAIDLGSNSFRAVTIDCSDFSILGEFEETVSTADGLSQTNNISDMAVDRILNAIQNAKKKLNFKPENTISKTTAAMRKASNSCEVLSKIKAKSDIDFEIISADEEARLTLLAIKHAIEREKIQTDDFIVLDIGGGSTELTICKKENTISKSFDFGIVTLTQCGENITDFLNMKKLEIYEFISNTDISNSLFISTAGTPTTIAAIKLGLNYHNYDRQKINGTSITPNDILQFSYQLNTLSLDEINVLVGSRRTPFMNTGASIFKMFFDVLQKTEAIVFDDGLREGIAIDWCLKNKSK